ncbi:MAG: hypothetical protein V7641_5192 [Blastocatellia bacterium]
MRRHQQLNEEVGMINRLIAAIASEIEMERAATTHENDLLREMEDAIADLRLARGVRLMLLNAYGDQPATEARRHSRAVRSRHAMDWSRTGQRVA